MPSRAKLTTRGISATTVTTETLPKNLPLTNNELDSNFINLRDQTFSIVGDDSTGIDIKAGDTIKFTGAGGASVSVAGDTVTITAGGGGGGGGSTGDLTIIGSTISGPSNADINITAGGTGNINLNADTVRLGDSATNAILTTNGAGDLILSTNDNTSTASIRIYDGNPGAIELNSFGGANINLNAGVGNIAIGSGSAEPGGITTQSTYDLHLNTNNNTTSANITIENGTGGGTGQIHLNPYGSDDYVFIGSGGKDGTGIANIRGGTGLYLKENSSNQEIRMQYDGGITIDTNDSGYLYIDAGTRYAGATTSVQSASDPTITIDAKKTTVTSVILTADAQIRIINFANVPGAFHRIYLQQDATGGRTASFSITDSTAIKWPYGPPVLSTDAYAIDMVELHSFDNSGPGGEQYEAVGVFTKGFTASYGPVDTVSYNNQNIRLLPNGSGNVILDLHTWPNTDGSNGQVLTTNGSGVLSWTTVSSSGNITFVGDDSTGTAVSINETFKIAGTQNITTAVSGDTLTITGPNLSSYLTNSPITIVGDDSTGTTLNTGETIKIAGGTGITTAVSGDVLTITATGGGGGGSTGDLTITGTTISAGTTNADITITSSGTGNLNVDMDTLRIGDLNSSPATITTNGADNLLLTTSSGAHGQIEITTGANGNITISPDNTGQVALNTYTTKIGKSGSDATLTTNTGDLILNTNSGSSSGSITIADGANGNITILPNGTGNVILSGGTVQIEDFTFTGTTISAGTTNADITLSSTGTGNLNVDMDTLRLGDLDTDATITTNGGGALILNTNSGLNAGNITLSAGANANITLTPNGTGDVVLSADTVQIGDSNTDATITTNGTGDLNLNTNSGTNSGVINIADGANANITLTPNGTGKVHLNGTAMVNGTITTNGASNLILNTNNGTSTGAIQITAGPNSDITLQPAGTGDVYLSGDTVVVGDSGANATITTNSTGDLILNTNAGTNSGSITIADGANGTMTIATNGTGYLDLNKSFDSTNFPQTPASGNTNWAGATSTSYVGTRMLYSNQAQGDITQTDDRVRANTRLVSIKHPNDSTTYNDTDYVIQNTDLIVLDINGQSFGSTLTGSRGASVRGEANNVIMKNTAGGTKTGPNLIGGSGFVEVENGHGGDLTAVNAMGFRSFISNRANTGEFTRITNAYGYLAEGIGAGGSGTSGTNRFVTNEFGFWSQGSTSSNLVTNYYGFYANTGATATNKYAFYSADDAYLSRLGTIERVREKQNALTSSPTITVDADLAPVHTVTLAENTQFGITGLSTGQTVTIIITQDGVGNRTATFTSDTSTAVKFAGGTPALSTAANAIDVVKIYNDGTNFLGVIEKAFA